MPLDSVYGVSHSETLATGRFVDYAHVAETIESVEHAEEPFHRGPARGILIGVMIGSVAWLTIFAAVALAWPIFFG